VKKKERRFKIEQIVSFLDLYVFDEAAAEKYAFIRVQLERQGIVISERDTQIASIAVAYNLTVVTHNVKEFARIETLKIENWATP
jgi:tRNA(fMet)-specific endonuclease VapC